MSIQIGIGVRLPMKILVIVHGVFILTMEMAIVILKVVLTMLDVYESKSI